MNSTVTYTPADNKLRLYVGRVPRDEYEELRAAGFVSTPKQDCDFAAVWTPYREDLARQYLEEGEDIADEDYSPTERAADRAERFEGYREKRENEATDAADRFEAGPAAYGHQNRARAERQARRADRTRRYAIGQWDKAEYWQQRTAGVIAHALHREDARTRRGRILTLEAEQRKHLAAIQKDNDERAAWERVRELEGASEVMPEDREQWKPAHLAAYNACATDHTNYRHPRSEEANAESLRIHGRVLFSAYDLLTRTEFIGKPFEQLTPAEVATMRLAYERSDAPESYTARWTRHYELRLGYERAMLENEGGTAAAADMEPGGWIGQHQIHKVNKSPATGRVVSVLVRGKWGFTTVNGRRVYLDHENREGLTKMNIERLDEGSYRPPTDEERAAFQAQTKAAKAERKATTPKAPSLINPTEEDALRLQSILNDRGRRLHAEKAGKYSADFEPTEIIRTTQARYSAASKGEYARAETRTLYADGKVARRSSNLWTSEGAKYDAELSGPVGKIRMYHGKGWYSPDAIIVITDKPQKPLPLDWERLEAPETAEATA